MIFYGNNWTQMLDLRVIWLSAAHKNAPLFLPDVQQKGLKAETWTREGTFASRSHFKPHCTALSQGAGCKAATCSMFSPVRCHPARRVPGGGGVTVPAAAVRGTSSRRRDTVTTVLQQRALSPNSRTGQDGSQVFIGNGESWAVGVRMTPQYALKYPVIDFLYFFYNNNYVYWNTNISLRRFSGSELTSPSVWKLWLVLTPTHHME